MDELTHSSIKPKPLWGILGGMGPLASTEFLNTIYRLSLERAGKEGNEGKEQDMARVILVSDPSVPDRTEAIVTRRDKPEQFEEVKRRLKQSLEMLDAMHVDRIVIPCITAHFFLPYLDLEASVRSRICSLISIVCEALRADGGKYVLLRTNGTRDEQIFENHPGWEAVRDQIKPLEEADQKKVH